MSRVVAAAIQWADLRAEVDPITGDVRHDPRSFGLPPADAAALEVALGLSERWGAEVVAVTAGPAAADAGLREALAAGASRAVRVEMVADAVAPDVAGALAAVVEETNAAIVCCGAAGPDRGSGATPAFLAHRLGAAQALGLVSLEPGDPGEVLAVRRLDGGRRERLRLRAPGVLSVEGAAARLRRASLAGELAARTAVIESRPAPARPAPPAGVLRPFRPRARVLPGPTGATPVDRIGALVGATAGAARVEPVTLSPAAAADRLLAALREWGELQP